MGDEVKRLRAEITRMDEVERDNDAEKETLRARLESVESESDAEIESLKEEVGRRVPANKLEGMQTQLEEARERASSAERESRAMRVERDQAREEREVLEVEVERMRDRGVERSPDRGEILGNL